MKKDLIIMSVEQLETLIWESLCVKIRDIIISVTTAGGSNIIIGLPQYMLDHMIFSYLGMFGKLMAINTNRNMVEIQSDKDNVVLLVHGFYEKVVGII